jgi:hypothetical protein
MTSDEELIRQRQAHDYRIFMIRSLDPLKAPRLAPATQALRTLLAGTPSGVTWSEALATMLRASDIAVKTADNIIRQAISGGLVSRTGEYERKLRKANVDNRTLRLIEWPTDI